MEGLRVERTFNAIEATTGMGFATPDVHAVWSRLWDTFPDRRGYHMSDLNIKSNRVPSDYDPYFNRDTEDMARILHGIQQYPFLDESDLICRVPGRVFLGHSVHLNHNDPKNRDPRLALAEFQERLDRYNNRPLGAEPMESPQMHYVRNLHELRKQDQPSTETINNLYAINLDKGIRSYEAKLASASKAHYIEHEQVNNRHREQAKRLDRDIAFRKKRAGNPDKQRRITNRVHTRHVHPPHNAKIAELHERVHKLRKRLSSIDFV